MSTVLPMFVWGGAGTVVGATNSPMTVAAMTMASSVAGLLVPSAREPLAAFVASALVSAAVRSVVASTSGEAGMRTGVKMIEMTLGESAVQGLSPSVLVGVRNDFDPTRPFDVLFYMRGWNSCVQAIASSSPMPCRHGGTVRQHSDVFGQFSRAGWKQLLLVMPEWQKEMPTSDPGRLGRQGGFEALLDAIFAEIAPVFGGRRPVRSGIRHVYVAAHSGGYYPAARLLDANDLPVRAVLLIDALYGNERSFIDASRRGVALALVHVGGTPERKSRELVRSLGGVEHEGLNGAPLSALAVSVKINTTHSKAPLGVLERWLSAWSGL